MWRLLSVQAVTHINIVQTDMISIFVWKQVNSGKGPSSLQAVCSRVRAQKWRSFVAQSFLFLFSAQEDRLSPSSEGGRGPEQLISVQASPWGMQERYHGDSCRREDPAWSRFLNGWGASADNRECRPRLDRICASGGPGGPPLASQSAVDRLNHLRFQPAGCYSNQACW